MTPFHEKVKTILLVSYISVFVLVLKRTVKRFGAYSAKQEERFFYKLLSYSRYSFFKVTKPQNYPKRKQQPKTQFRSICGSRGKETSGI